jgi:hypothetical protein
MLARRSIQKLLDDSATYLGPAQVERFAAHLNRNNRDSIEAEWELIVLASLASLGTVQYEQSLGGAARLDIRFVSPTIAFVADVTVVSDDEYDRQNPVTHLDEHLSRYSRKLNEEGIQGNFSFWVGGRAARPGVGEYKTRLALPQVHEFSRFIFDSAFQTFLAQIRREPSAVHHHVVNNERAGVSIAFSPGGGRYYSHLAYNLAHDLTHNVVYNALARKSDQIKRAGKREPRELAGVILSDGGCAMLRAMAGANVVPLDRVIRAFLRKSHTVDFVCAVDIYPTQSSSSGIAFEAHLWSLRHPKTVEAFRVQLKTALHKLPPPVRSAVNTLNRFVWADGSLQRLYSDYGGHVSMGGSSLKVSLRATMDYLAGRIDKTEYEHVVPPEFRDYLRRRIEGGMSIREVSISKSADQDDDTLVITFGARDPATSLFRARSDVQK